MNENHVIRCVRRVTKSLLNKYVILAAMLCSFGLLSAQNPDVKVTGTVLDQSSGEPLIGVSVLVKSSKQGTMTDINGVFTVKAKVGETLKVTYVGYAAQEVKVSSPQLKIRLKEDTKSLDEVVVIGYGTVKRKDVTGSISSVTGKDLLKTQPATFDQALQGKVAGVVVQQISGQPGGGVSIQIHGVSSVNGTNSPLYVIDGIIIPPSSDPGNGSNPLSSINPSEIESIDVLKDASATAIYGSQATNGVVVITTKRGKTGAPKITYDFYVGYQEVPKKLPVVNLQQFATLLDARANEIYGGWSWDARPQFANPKYLGTGTDWQGALFRSAPTTNHSLTISGGDNTTQYLLSTSYFDQQGIALGSDFKRYSVRLNLDNKTTDWLKIGTSLQLAHIDEDVNSTQSSVIKTALDLTPDVSVKNADGTYGGVTNPSGVVQPTPNPIALALINKDKKLRNQLFGNIYAEIQFTKDLSLRNEVSGNFDFNTEDKFSPSYTLGLAVRTYNDASYSYGQNIYTSVRNFLTYSHSFKQYNLNAMVGHEAQLNTYQNVSAARKYFPSNNVTSISSGDATTATNDGSKGSGPALEAYFGRVYLSWNDKYLVTGNLRDDGCSNFAVGNRWVYTYSGAFAWKINNEEFLKNVKVINELKLRLGYGLTNNQGIPGNTYVTQLTSAANGLSGTSQFQGNLANPNVSWETTKNYNIGLDGTFLNSRLDFSFDIYDRKTDGLLLQVPLPIYSGTTSGPGNMAAPYENVGSVSNKGFDLRISSTNIRNKNFTWKTDLTISHNENKVLSLGAGGSDANLSQTNYTNNEVAEKTVVGKPIGEFYGYVYDGVFATANDFKTHALPVDQNGKPYPISPNAGGIWYGDRKFKDLNGDGVIDTKDQTFLGSPRPTFQFGFSNSFTYKGFDLNIFFSANVGNKVLNRLAITLNDPQNHISYFTSVLDYAKLALVNPNGSATDVNNVYVTNPNTSIVGLRNNATANDNNRSSDLFIEDGSFLRCKNITLGYRLPENILSKIHLYSVRIYGSVTNAFLITKYSGMDPEIGSWNPLQAGWDDGYYPQSRTFTIGANITFSK